VVSAVYEDSAATGVDGNQADNSADASGAAYAIDVSNLLRNGDFEQDAPKDGHPDFWSQQSAFTRSGTKFSSGRYAGRHKATDNRSYAITQTARDLAVGAGHNVGCWVNIPATGDAFTFKLQVRWKDGAGATITSVTILTRTTPTSGWLAGFQTLSPPGGTASAELRMAVTSLNATIYVDDCTINRG
jgi:hypothetical protein